MSDVSREFQDGEIVPGTRYRVCGLIGAGGMGCVYEVEHLELGKRFVLKALLRELADRKDLEAGCGRSGGLWLNCSITILSPSPMRAPAKQGCPSS